MRVLGFLVDIRVNNVCLGSLSSKDMNILCQVGSISFYAMLHVGFTVCLCLNRWLWLQGYFENCVICKLIFPKTYVKIYWLTR